MMTEQEASVQHHQPEPLFASAEPEPPTLADAIRFLHRKRMALLARFVVFVALGVVVLAIWFWTTPPRVEGRLVLSFRGIESGNYPSGRKFSPEDLRARDLLSGALADADISAGRADLNRVSARLVVLPLIPPAVVSRWKKADRDGVKREDYSPSDFDLALSVPGLSPGEQVRLFDAILKRYQRRVKFEESATLSFISSWSEKSYRDLANQYDYWDIPNILDQNVELLNRYLKQLIEESQDYKDPTSLFSFRDVQKELKIWSAIRLEALKGVTYRGKLVKDKDTALLTAQYRLEDLDIQVRRRSGEALEAMKLLEASQKPQALAATQSATRDGFPIVDASVLDRLVRSDYLGPLVKRISELQEETKRLEAEKWRLEKDMTILPQTHNITPSELPTGYRDLVATASAELGKIIQNYNRLLDSYLTATLSKLVVVKDGPRITRGFSTTVVLLAIFFLSAVAAILLVTLQHVIGASLRST
jgi:hypothetical protein